MDLSQMIFYYPNNDDESKRGRIWLIRKKETGKSTGFIKTKFNEATFRFSNLDNYYMREVA